MTYKPARGRVAACRFQSPATGRQASPTSQKIESPERLPIAGGPRLTIDTRGPCGTLHVRTRSLRPALKQTLKSVKRAPKG